MTITNWDVKPGVAIGPYTLGSHINEVLGLITNAPNLDTVADIEYGDIGDGMVMYPILSNSTLGSIKLSVPDYGLVLEFDQDSQRLVLITLVLSSVSNSNKLVLNFNNKPFFCSKSSTSCRDVVNNFPPTTLGVFDSDALSYKMSFPQGLDFTFKIASRTDFDLFKSKREHPTGSNGHVAALDSIRLSSTSSSVADGLSRFEIVPLHGARFYPAGTNQPTWIELGSGLQDVFTVLGAPDAMCGSIYNYFHLGLDVKVDPSRLNAVSKLIFHTNCPGLIVFGRYRKAIFDIVIDPADHKVKGKTPTSTDSKVKRLSAQSSLVTCVEQLSDPGQPLVVNNQNSPMVQYYYSFEKGLNIEFMPDGRMASIEVCS